ncbi:MAG: hypothetical protein ACKOQ4_10930, partial [Mycobacterium sp.]
MAAGSAVAARPAGLTGQDAVRSGDAVLTGTAGNGGLGGNGAAGGSGFDAALLVDGSRGGNG